MLILLTIRPTTNSYTNIDNDSFERLNDEDEGDEAVDTDGDVDLNNDENGILLDAGREVRCKLYHGLVSSFSFSAEQ